MSDLHHPSFVSAALDRVDEMTGLQELQAGLAIVDRGNPEHIPDAALVRLLRRCSVEPDVSMEAVVFETLMARTVGWARWKFSGLDACNRDDIAQGVAMAVIDAIRSTTKVDFWEIDFDKKRKWAAADVYQDQFAAFELEDEAEPEVLAEVGSDDGVPAAETTERAYRLTMGRRVLSGDEFEVFETLVRLGLPIALANLRRLSGVTGVQYPALALGGDVPADHVPQIGHGMNFDGAPIRRSVKAAVCGPLCLGQFVALALQPGGLKERLPVHASGWIATHFRSGTVRSRCIAKATITAPSLR